MSSSYEQLKYQTLLFFIEKLIERSPRTLHDLSCQFGNKNFNKSMRILIGNSQTGLLKFLGSHPTLFSIQNDLVSFNNYETVGGTPDYHQDAVGYFRNCLLQYGSGMTPVNVPIKSLFGHRSQANVEVRTIVGNNLLDFREFLGRNPGVFRICEAGEFVRLVQGQDGSTNGEEVKEGHLAQGNGSEDNSDDSLKLEPSSGSGQGQFWNGPGGTSSKTNEVILTILQLFIQLISTKGPMLIEQLFHELGTSRDISYFESLFKNMQELREFLKTYSSGYVKLFQIHTNLVTLTEGHATNMDFLKKQHQYLLYQEQAQVKDNKTTGLRSKIRDSGSEVSGQVPEHSSPRNDETPTAPTRNISKGPLQRHQSLPVTPGSKFTLDTPGSKVTSSPSPKPSNLKQKLSSLIQETISSNNEKYSNNNHPHKAFQVNRGQTKEIPSSNNNSTGSIISQIETRISTHILRTLGPSALAISEIIGGRGDLEVIGVEVKGLSIGPNGKVTLIQLFNPKLNRSIIFDILESAEEEQDQILGQLKERVLENAHVLKVLHNSSNLSINLYNQFKIRLKNIFDVSLAHNFISLTSTTSPQSDLDTDLINLNVNKNVNLTNLYSIYNLPIGGSNPKDKTINESNKQYWLKRPLSKQSINSLNLQTHNLMSLYDLLKDQVKERNHDLFKELCSESIDYFISPDEIKAKRKIRKNVLDAKALERKLLSETIDLKSIVLSNREIRLLKHISLPPELLQLLNFSSYKISKKLQLTPPPPNSNLSSTSTSSSTNSLTADPGGVTGANGAANSIPTEGDGGSGGPSSHPTPGDYMDSTTFTMNSTIDSLLHSIDSIITSNGHGHDGQGHNFEEDDDDDRGHDYIGTNSSAFAFSSGVARTTGCNCGRQLEGHSPPPEFGTYKLILRSNAETQTLSTGDIILNQIWSD